MPRPLTNADIALSQELRMEMLDAGIRSEAFYWTIHGKVALVAVAEGMKRLILADTPVKAIRQAGSEMFGGL